MPLSEIQVDIEALRHNVRSLRSVLAPDRDFVAVVKANAYGHGLDVVVPAIEDLVDAFQVDDLEELRALRRVTESRALVFGYVAEEDLPEALALGGELALYDLRRIQRLGELVRETGHRPLVHLKVDALLGRQGVLPAEVGAFGRAIAEAGLNLGSVYAHLANLEDGPDTTHAQAQADVLAACHVELRETWPHLGRHLSATSGLMALDGALPNHLVRVGVGIYGLYPSPSFSRSFRNLSLRPVLGWVSRLAQVKTLPTGHPVGYGLTYRTSRPTVVGIVPQGYADGYDRGLSNVGEVLVRGQRCPVIGRVAMNMFAIDLTAVPDAHAEEEVVLLGSQGEERIAAEEIADRTGTIAYEVIARLSPLLARRPVTPTQDGGTAEAILTPRLLLRRFREEDWRSLFRYIRHPEVVRWEPHYPEGEEGAREVAAYFAGTGDFWNVVLRETDEGIGHLHFGLRTDQPAEDPARNLGFIFDPEFGGRGYAREACQALLEFGRNRLGAHPIVTGTGAENLRSRRLLERLGFQRIDDVTGGIVYRREA